MLVTLLKNYGTIFGLAWSLNIQKNFPLYYHPVFNRRYKNNSLSPHPHMVQPHSPLPIPVLSFKGWEKEILYILGFIKELLTQQYSHFVYWFPS